MLPLAAGIVVLSPTWFNVTMSHEIDYGNFMSAPSLRPTNELSLF